MPNISIGPFGLSISESDITAFFSSNGITVTGVAIDASACRRTATAQTADPVAAVAACNRKIMGSFKVTVAEI